MPAIAQDLELWAADDIAIDIAIHEADGVTPFDLHSTTANWAVSSVYDHSVAVLRKSSASGGDINITDEASGLLTILLTPEDTDGLGGQLYYHELEIVDGAGATVTVLCGTLKVNKTIPATP